MDVKLLSAEKSELYVFWAKPTEVLIRETIEQYYKLDLDNDPC